MRHAVSHLAFVTFLAAAVLVGGCQKTSKLSPIAPEATVLAFGDSVTFGTGAAAGEDWPSLLAKQTGWRIENAGVPGDTAQAAKARMQGLLDEHAPALVIIEIGGNDFLQRRPQKVVKEDLRPLIRAARQSGAQVVIIAVPELSALAVLAGRPSDASIYRELGDEEKIAVINGVFADVLSRAELRADPIHPNSQGYRKMASEIHAQLKTLGLADDAARAR